MSEDGGAPRVWVTGASSQLGVFLLPRLRNAGFDVLALSRQAPEEPVAVHERLSWAHPSALTACVASRGHPEFIVSAGPPGVVHDLVERGAGLRKVVVFTSTSILTKMDEGHAAERGMLQDILSGEQRLRQRCGESDVALVLLRPTLIYGCGRDRNLSRLLAFGERSGFIPVSSRAGGLRQPVHADDLAALAVDALQADTGDLLECPACGGEQLSYREMVERTARCGSRPIRVQPLPPWLLSALVGLRGLFGDRRDTNAGMVRRQSRDMIFDDSPLRQSLGWNPRPFDPGPEDFRLPREVLEWRRSRR
jgi:nucleoside-diphosphate-sugar epimerase